MVVTDEGTWTHTFTTEQVVSITRSLEEAFRAALVSLWGAGERSAGEAYWRQVTAARRAALDAFDPTGSAVERVTRAARVAFERAKRGAR